MSSSSPSKIALAGPPDSGAALRSPTEESTKKANELLQQNHDNFHIFWDFEDRLHNHVAHHLLAVYALGASAEELQFAYDTNVKTQIPIGDTKPPVLRDVSNSDDWGKYLADAENYATFLQYFQDSIKIVGWQETIKKYIFSEKAVNDGMPERLVAGFLHPWIHLGYGIEFEQPAIIAEGLAQTAVHDDWPGRYLKACMAAATAAASKNREYGNNTTIVSLFDEASGSEKLRKSTKWSDPQKNKAVYANAFDEMVALASKWYIPPTASDEVIARASAELASAAAFICSATPRLDKKVKFDFFLMHTVTSSVFLDVWIRQKWLGNAEKSVLINYFGWMVVNMYVSRGCADINFDQVKSYKAKEKDNQWVDVAARVTCLKDDGHVSKTVRALVNAEKVSQHYNTTKGFEVGTDLYLKIAEMAVDAAEDQEQSNGDEPLWVRSTGHPEAWAKVGPRSEYIPES
ncbi:uncharacterized protein DFL_008359 [Arthrobotrys flagrans]|uniref:Oxidoreductase AflY n=1 Tax=Arthrobotrys flagrans TaxID=97331 RepID=A0A436ZNT2_ARTFL|nr:hypothetical protein DFL_008359 [Arthrobotrys flagrans]